MRKSTTRKPLLLLCLAVSALCSANATEYSACRMDYVEDSGTRPVSDSVRNNILRGIPDANVVGHVLDKVTGEHLPFITISVKGTMINTMTDATGHYFLKDLPKGTFEIEASCMGYKKTSRTVSIDGSNTQEVNFELEEDVLNIDEVVVSSTKNVTDKKTSSTIVNVMSEKVFEAVSSNTLSESIAFQPGVRVESTCANCGSVQLRINGLEGQYTQMLLDSRPIFSSLSAVYGLEQLPVSMIERVEVIRGGGSALFGANAIGGVVNIITKEPLRNSLSLSHNINILENGALDNNTALNGSYVSADNKTGVYIFGMLRDRNPYDRNGDGFSDIPVLNSQTIGFRGYHKLSAYSKLTAEYHHISEYRRGGDSLDLPPHEALIAEQTRHSIDGGSLSYDLMTPDGKHAFGAHVAAQGISRSSYYGADRNPDAYGQTRDLSVNAGAQYTYKFSKLLWSPSDLSAGVEYNYNDLHDIILGYGRDMKQKVWNAGAYLQNEWKSDKLNLLIGVRADKHSLMDEMVFSPRFNLRYSPVDWIGLRLSYSSGFRAPQAFNEDLHIEAIGGTVSVIELDPDLRPEYSHSVSGSVDLYRQAGRFQFNLLVEGFYTRLNDMFDLVNTGMFDNYGNLVFERVNANGADIAGLNVEFMAGIPDVFDVQMGYTFQKSTYLEDFEWSEDVAPQRNMFRAPDHYAYLASNFYIWKSLKLNLFGNFTGPMLVQHVSTGEGIPDSEKWTEAFVDLGFKVSYDFKITNSFVLEVNAGMKNVLDQYQKDLDFGATKDAGYIYGPSVPRLYFAGIKIMI